MMLPLLMNRRVNNKLPVGLVSNALILEDGVASDPVPVRVEFDVADRVSLATYNRKSPVINNI